MDKLRTGWFDKVDRECPLAEYPRPQLVRDNWLCLNGSYDYAVTGENDPAPKEYQGKILVPFSIESDLSGVGRALKSTERLWYRRFFTLDGDKSGKRILLHFEAVDWECSVYINGREAGSHRGGYNPFCFDITDLIKDGENELTVKVYDPTDDGYQQRGKQFLRPVGFWYTATSGIWQTVWIECVEEKYIKSIRLTPDIDRGVINVSAQTNCVCGFSLTAAVYDGEKEICSADITGGADIPVPGAHLWSPEDPFLYKIIITLDCDGCRDEVESYFGMRKFSIMKDSKGIPRLALNNKPYFMRGLLDQGYWPESQLTAPTDEAMIFDIAEMKRLGFNMLRKHIKEEPRRWYYHCDRLGMLVWQDMMSGGKPLNLIYAGAFPNINVHVKDNQYKMFNRDKPEWRKEFEEEYKGLIDNLYNNVSICCWVPFNEGWGQFDALRIGRWTKKYDPSRLVDHASGWHDQGGPDFKSVHKYVTPVHLPTARRTAGRPYVLSEFGGYSWNIKGHVWNYKRSFGYIQFGNSESLSKAYRRLHFKQIIPLIERGLSATVYTQVSDVEFEVNGIYSYDRKVLKISEDVLKECNEKMVLR